MKKEPIDPPEDAQLKERITKFIAEPIPTKLKLQAMSVTCDQILPAARHKPMLHNFVEVLEKHSTQVTKLLEAVTRVAQGAEVKRSKMPALLKTLDNIYKHHDELHSFAVLNKMIAKKSRKK